MFSSKKPDAKAVAKQAKREIKSSQRDIDREIRELDRTEKQLIANIKAEAKKGREGPTRILAKQLIDLRKQKERLIQGSARMTSLSYQTTAIATNQSMMQAVGGATKAIGALNAAMPVQETMRTMNEFAKQNEMMEMREETLDDMLTDVFDTEETEAEADGVVSQVLAEIGLEVGATLTDAPTTAVAGQRRAVADDDLDALLASLDTGTGTRQPVMRPGV